jgi:hypothetical protein
VQEQAEGEAGDAAANDDDVHAIHFVFALMSF